MTDTTPIPELDGPAVLDSELLLGLHGRPGKQSYLIMSRTIRTKVTAGELRELTTKGGDYRLPTLTEYHIIVDALQYAFPDGIYYLHGTQLDDILTGKSSFGNISLHVRNGRIQQAHGMCMGQDLDAVLIRRPEPWTQLSKTTMLRKVGPTKVAFLNDKPDGKWEVVIHDSPVLKDGQGKSRSEAEDLVDQVNANFAKSQPGLDAEHYCKLKRNSVIIVPDQPDLQDSIILRVSGRGSDLDKVLDSVRENKVL